MPPPGVFVYLRTKFLAQEKKCSVPQFESVSRRAKKLKSALKSNKRRLTAAKHYEKLQERKLVVAVREEDHLRKMFRAFGAGGSARGSMRH